MPTVEKRETLGAAERQKMVRLLCPPLLCPLCAPGLHSYALCVILCAVSSSSVFRSSNNIYDTLAIMMEHESEEVGVRHYERRLWPHIPIPSQRGQGKFRRCAKKHGSRLIPKFSPFPPNTSHICIEGGYGKRGEGKEDLWRSCGRIYFPKNY